MYKFSFKPVNSQPVLDSENRRIHTGIPAPATVPVLEGCLLNEPLSMNNQLPLAWDKALDYQVFDNAGNVWIDFTSCIFVANVGHAHPRICQVIKDTVDRGLLNSYYYPTDLRKQLTEKLIEIAPPRIDRVLLLTTGSECVEAALKMMLLKGKSSGRTKVIAFENAFHGKTMGSQLAGGKPGEKKWIPLSQTFVHHLPFPYPWILEQKNMSPVDFFYKSLEDANIDPSTIAGIITEPYQGWSATFLPVDFAKELRRWSEENNILLAIDEIQSGFGRTGKMFAYEHFDIEPDLIICGKAISSSLPLSALLTSAEICGDDQSFNSTHGSNPVCVAAAAENIRIIQDEMLVHASREKGSYLFSLLEEWRREEPKHIKAIYGKGLLASVFIEAPDGNHADFVDQLIEQAFRMGLLSVRTVSGTLKIGPPLTIPQHALKEGIDILKEALQLCK